MNLFGDEGKLTRGVRIVAEGSIGLDLKMIKKYKKDKIHGKWGKKTSIKGLYLKKERPNIFCIPAINTVFPVCTKMIAIANHKKTPKKPKLEMNQRKDTTPFYRFHTGVTFTRSYFCLFVLTRKKNESNVGSRKIIPDHISQDIQFSHKPISCRNYKIKSKKSRLCSLVSTEGGRSVQVLVIVTGNPCETTPFVAFFFLHGEDQITLLFINAAGCHWRGHSSIETAVYIDIATVAACVTTRNARMK